MFVEELDVTVVDASSNFLADLVRGPTLDHVETCPSVFGLRTRGGANEKVVFELALQVVLFDMVSQGSGDFPGEQS